VLGGIAPAQCIISWLEKHPASRNQDYIKLAGRDIMKQVDEILDYANDVSQPDNYATRGYWEERDGAAPPFCEDWYLRQNPDVAIAVQLGECPSGAAHYNHYGRKEGRCPSPEQADLYTTWRTFTAPPPRQAA
ncbi:hypothetical protein NKW57_12400, partial [Acetobacter cerevisiae]|nr:hypothetical protein [Acetobacter cerevisiae]